MSSSINQIGCNLEPTQKIYNECPKDFNPVYKVAIVAVFCTSTGEYLLLKRSRGEEADQEKWNCPGGKIEEGEAPEYAAHRELWEESGHKAALDQLKKLRTIYHITNFDKKQCAIAHIFTLTVERPFKPNLNAEHSAYIWVNPDKAFELPLISKDFFEALFSEAPKL